ncbi:DNA polymerase III subunit alpha [Candidatus Uhrbacteria bacterium CG_4_9_14_3_um_filter_36_7]|uniref:DNA polymerase III subunit alpha n=1 Tax=Candidatus Uhrbacteria bacterium CG_4_9_14_3_um_filter_36_7 TaxID=1975033 RepID=A0A2M7XIF1_9BACT|nr:MAG: DNA polymerase III subunit alpha [Candidatus Uhrbacteria bacterium CG_4_9_14_3_um_filter_36_7]
MNDFVHLHVHSHYSLLGALPKSKDLIKAVKDRGMNAFAITDHGALYGVIEMYQKAKDAEVKLIIGMDAYLALNGRLQKRARIDTKNHRLVLLAENNIGYKNLLTLSSIGFLEGFYYHPRIDREVLQMVCENKPHGLIALSGGFQGEIEEAIIMEHDEDAKRLILEYVDLFGEGNFYLELVDRPEIPAQEAINAKLIEFGKSLGVPVVATKNVFYLNPEDAIAWKILQCVRGGKTLEQFERSQAYDYDASLALPSYMINRFSDIPEAIENTRKIADRCQVELELGKWHFAKFPIPEEKTAINLLQEKTFEGLKRRGMTLTESIQKRADYELEIIRTKGFDVYFLIVADFINWARNNGIVTTTRGSAAGSLVAYAIGISDIDPIRYELPFERFLNPERPSAPDIDADFADNRRDEVFSYVCERYGKDKVAQICTFGTMLARGSVRDVGRALGLAYGFVDHVAKLIPFGSQGFPMTLKRAIEESPELKELYTNDSQVQRLIDLSMRIEGCARHVSVHAAGVVIAPTRLTDFTPLQIDTREGKTITQYEMKSVEAAGLVKMDFLGIRNLSILGDAIELVKKIKGIEIKLEQIPVDDPKTFKLLAKGQTMGLFQLNGDGMTKYLMELEPERIEDIMAMVALYRPGPIESIPEYIKRKHDPSCIRYQDSRMKDFLDKSYGLLVYQDDVMLTAIHLAGYSWLEADQLRKAMGKKIPAVMAEQKEKLIKGLIEHGMSSSKADALWHQIEPFAAYGFNKAHAASYGMIAYFTAYMKANYPVEYMTALMTAESHDLETVAQAVYECKRMGIQVLSPDINESRLTFTYIDEQTIRFGLLVVKNLGEEVTRIMIEERERHGIYQDLSDFLERIHHRAFNKKSLEALIKSGALDRFGERNQLLENIELLLQFHRQFQIQKEQNQASLFEMVPELAKEKFVLKPAPVAKQSVCLAWEKELLGLYVSAHPFEQAFSILKDHLTACGELLNKRKHQYVSCGGLVVSVKEILTKQNERMAFITLEDLSGKIEAIAFPKVYASIKTFCQPDRLLVISAKISQRKGEETKLLVHHAQEIEEEHILELKQKLQQGIWTETPNVHSSQKMIDIVFSGQPSAELIDGLREIFTQHKGTSQICFCIEMNHHSRRIKTDYFIKDSPEILDVLATMVGRQNVRHIC